MLKNLKAIGLALVYLVGSIVSLLALIFALLDDLFFFFNSQVWRLRGLFK